MITMIISEDDYDEVISENGYDGDGVNNRELKQPRRRRQQERHKFAYLTMKKQYFCTICTCIFHFWTFRRRSRSFHDVK